MYSTKPSNTLLFATMVASLGGLLFGFDTIVISGCQNELASKFRLDGLWQGFMTASALIGTAIGAIFAGRPGDMFGRRDCLKICGGLYLISALGCAMSDSLSTLTFFRFVGGLGVGASSVLAPLYLAEVASKEWRGRVVAFFQFNIVFGVLIALLSNLLIDLAHANASTSGVGFTEPWRWKLGIQALPSIVFLALLFCIPRSPRWLAMQNKEQESIRSLQTLGAEDPQVTFMQISESLQLDREQSTSKLYSRTNAKPLFLAFTVASFNQLGGINALWYYLNPILESGGFDATNAGIATIVLGLANLIATLVGMILIDRIGRRPLLLWGATGTLVSMAMVAFIFSSGRWTNLLVWLLSVVVICHAFGQGSVIWVYISEVFSNSTRAKGQAFGSFVHWVWAMLVSWTFPMLAGKVGEQNAGIPFAFFAAMMVLQIAIVWLWFPETKQVSLEAISLNIPVDSAVE